jgi:hypothetical protein
VTVRLRPRGGGPLSLRIAFYSHNGFGLGHFTRNAKLARALLRRRPNADILLILEAVRACRPHLLVAEAHGPYGRMHEALAGVE